MEEDYFRDNNTSVKKYVNSKTTNESVTSICDVKFMISLEVIDWVGLCIAVATLVGRLLTVQSGKRKQAHEWGCHIFS